MADGVDHLTPERYRYYSGEEDIDATSVTSESKFLDVILRRSVQFFFFFFLRLFFSRKACCFVGDHGKFIFSLGLFKQKKFKKIIINK